MGHHRQVRLVGTRGRMEMKTGSHFLTRAALQARMMRSPSTAAPPRPAAAAAPRPRSSLSKTMRNTEANLNIARA